MSKKAAPDEPTTPNPEEELTEESLDTVAGGATDSHPSRFERRIRTGLTTRTSALWKKFGETIKAKP